MLNVNLSFNLIKHRHEEVWEWRYSSIVLNVGATWKEHSVSRPGRFTPPGTRPSVPIAYEAWWATEPVWTLWRSEKSLAPAGSQTQLPRGTHIEY
jgi:hypothetical protein